MSKHVKGCIDSEAHGQSDWHYIHVEPGPDGMGEQTERCLMCDLTAERKARREAEELVDELTEALRPFWEMITIAKQGKGINRREPVTIGSWHLIEAHKAYTKAKKAEKP